MKNKIQEQVLNRMYEIHYELNKKTKTSSIFDVDCVTEAISLTIELIEEENKEKINNWVKKMHIKSWDNLLIETKEKQKADFQKMIEELESFIQEDNPQISHTEVQLSYAQAQGKILNKIKIILAKLNEKEDGK